MKEEFLRFKKGGFNLILETLEIPNIFSSLEERNFEILIKTHTSVYEFMDLAPYLCSKNKDWIPEKSAFLIYYQTQAFHLAHRSFLEALAGYYNAAYILLRSCHESLIRGAFWECLAHKKFRDNARVLEKKKKDLLGLFNVTFEAAPKIEKKLEENSKTILELMQPILEDKARKKLIPDIHTMIEQLAQWEIFDPVPDPVKTIYDFYQEFSADVHIIPDKTDVGRRLLKGKDIIFETSIDPDELSKFSKILHRVIDIGTVIELNILSDWIEHDEKVKNRLKKRMKEIDSLGLKLSSEKLQSLVKA